MAELFAGFEHGGVVVAIGLVAFAAFWLPLIWSNPIKSLAISVICMGGALFIAIGMLIEEKSKAEVH